MNRYFISDTHFNHKNIIKYDNRPFSSVEEMNETIVSNWNNKVTKSDIVYLIGDIGQQWQEYIKRLSGQIHLILGNHDNFTKKNYVYFRSVSQIKTIKISGDKIIMCHFPLRTWVGDIHLHGHSHGNGEIYPNSLDMSCNLWDYTPASYDKVKSRLERMNKIVDEGIRNGHFEGVVPNWREFKERV